MALLEPRAAQLVARVPVAPFSHLAFYGAFLQFAVSNVFRGPVFSFAIVAAVQSLLLLDSRSLLFAHPAVRAATLELGPIAHPAVDGALVGIAGLFLAEDGTYSPPVFGFRVDRPRERLRPSPTGDSARALFHPRSCRAVHGAGLRFAADNALLVRVTLLPAKLGFDQDFANLLHGAPATTLGAFGILKWLPVTQLAVDGFRKYLH
jgi:hypothetical protein